MISSLRARYARSWELRKKHYVNGIQNTDTGLHWPRVKFSAKIVRYERRSIEAFIQKCRSQY
ncbi:hypothetical protein VEE40_09370 [Escherichia coli]|nr:hypothetical protein VEE40_09370 [Escherichia coli]